MFLRTFEEHKVEARMYLEVREKLARSKCHHARKVQPISLKLALSSQSSLSFALIYTVAVALSPRQSFPLRTAGLLDAPAPSARGFSTLHARKHER